MEIELDGDNELKSGTQSAGLEKTSTGTLTLKDDNKEAGSLTATGGFNSAGIGGGYLGDGKNITITGGTVTATGGSSGAGIGGGVNGIGSKVTVSGAAQVRRRRPAAALTGPVSAPVLPSVTAAVRRRMDLSTARRSRQTSAA